MLAKNDKRNLTGITRFIPFKKWGQIALLSSSLIISLGSSSCTTSRIDEGYVNEEQFEPGKLQQRTFFHDGHKRSYWLYIPTDLAMTHDNLELDHSEPDEQEAPAILTVLHGSHQTGEIMIYMGGFETHAEDHRYVVLAPDAIGTSFNDGSKRIDPEYRSIDDSGFIVSLNNHIQSSLSTDTAKNYLAGFSSGASMTQRVVAESLGEFTAAVSVADHYWGPEMSDTSPLSMLFIFGDSDPLNPIKGGSVFHNNALTLNTPKPMQTAQRWARKMGCTTAITATVKPVKQRKWAGCNDRSSVMYLEVEELGHFWAGGKVQHYDGMTENEVGPYHSGFITTLVMWDFLNKLH